jgi:hypothetical protein
MTNSPKYAARTTGSKDCIALKENLKILKFDCFLVALVISDKNECVRRSIIYMKRNLESYGLTLH